MPLRRRARQLALASALLALAAPAAGIARPSAKPSVPACALGTSAADLRGFFAAELGRAERRYSSSRRARRRFSAAAAAYVYGLAPVALSETTQRFPQNQLVSIAALLDPTVRTVVLPNNDTTYTVGRLALSEGARVLDVPDTAGRYYVIQLLDAYSNTFAYVGRRTTGTKPGSYAIVPPGFDGELPSGVRRIQSPTKLVWVLGRTLVSGAADLSTVSRLMAGYKVTALDAWATGERQGPLVLGGFPTLAPVTLPTGLDFYAKLAEVLRSDPAPARDACALRAFARAGVTPDATPGSLAADGSALTAGARAGARIVRHAERRANRFGARRNNGWVLPGPYVGAYGRNYLGRAVIATAALGANTRPETVYPLAVADVDGRPLRGSSRYSIRFPRGELPPANAFWSVTLYGQDRYLVPNQIDRYSIGDRSSGLRRGRDGSLTIYVQHRAPKGAARANWLPAPAGRFRLAMRIYEPRRRVLTGRWLPPPVRRR